MKVNLKIYNMKKLLCKNEKMLLGHGFLQDKILSEAI